MLRHFLFCVFLLSLAVSVHGQAPLVPLEAGATWIYVGGVPGHQGGLQMDAVMQAPETQDGATVHPLVMTMRDPRGGLLQRTRVELTPTADGLRWRVVTDGVLTDDMTFRWPAEEGQLYTLGLTSGTPEVAAVVMRQPITVPLGTFDAVIYETRTPVEGLYQRYVFAPGTGLIEVAGLDAETGRVAFTFRLVR